jgi:hypothetical protein
MDGLVDKRPQTHDQKKTDYDAGMRGHPGFLRRHRFGFSIHRNAANVISELTSRQSSEGGADGPEANTLITDCFAKLHAISGLRS